MNIIATIFICTGLIILSISGVDKLICDTAPIYHSSILYLTFVIGIIVLLIGLAIVIYHLLKG